MTEMKRDGLVYGMSEDEYHGVGEFADHRFAELSSTHAKLILDSPAKYDYQRKSGVVQEPRVAFDLGTAAHTAILGTGASTVIYPKEHLTPAGNVSTKAATVEWARSQRTQGLVPISADQAGAVEAMKAAVQAHPTARMLFDRPGHSEVSVFDELLGVKRRGRFDRLPDKGGIAIDLKTADDASPNGFMKAAAKYGYHIQRGHYLDILKRATGREVDMLFVVVEKSPPYQVAVYRLSEQFSDMGDVEALHAADVYRRCMETGEWPGYPDGITDLAPPMYAIYDYQDKYESGEITL